MRHNICTVSEDISQVFATPTPQRIHGSGTMRLDQPGRPALRPSASVMPSRPTGLP